MMKQRILCAAAVTTVVLAACAAQDTDGDAALPTTDTLAVAAQPASVPVTSIPDAFTTQGTTHSYNARKAYDLTGDGRPETVVQNAMGPRPDTAEVELLILATAGDTLYRNTWNTQSYFQYEYRNTFTDSAANAKITRHLRRVLSDSAFTAEGPSAGMKRSIPGGIDRDAVRYDMKEAAVRSKHSLPAGAPLNSAQYEEMQKTPVSAATIDSIVGELATMSTFTYYAGGEITYTLAWSPLRKRFVRIFSCC